MEFELTDKQDIAWDDFFDPSIAKICYDGGSRSGKTYLIMLGLVMTAMISNAKIICLRKYRTHARSKLWEETFLPIVKNLEGWDLSETYLEATHVSGGKIIFDGCDTKERVEKILGGEYTKVFLNEFVQNTYDVFNLLLTRLSYNAVYNESATGVSEILADTMRKGMPVPQQMIVDTNPRTTRHWGYRVAVLQQDPKTGKPLPDANKWRRRVWTPYDNPHLSQAYRDTLDALPGIMRKRMRDGIWCDAEGLVYGNFDDKYIYTDAPAGFDSMPRVRGIDFGFTNPFVCLWAAIGRNKELYIYREHYKSQILIEDHAKHILQYPEPIQWTVADHDAGDRAILNKMKIRTICAKKAVIEGIHFCMSLIEQGKVFVHESCENLLNEFFSYRWQEPKEGRSDSEEPVKENDHAMDTFRYIAMQVHAGSRLIVH